MAANVSPIFTYASSTLPDTPTMTSLMPADGLHWVSSSSQGSDANDGLSPTTPFATIGKAMAVLGVDPNVVELLGGTHLAPATGAKFVARQGLHGIGATGTKIQALSTTPAGSAVVQLGGSRSAVRDLWITGAPINTTTLRVTCTPSSTEDVRLDNVFVDSLGAHAIAYGIGDDVSNDVSEICLTSCCSVGNGISSIHIQVGNGATGNVLDIANFGGNSSNHLYGVRIAGGGFVSTGLNFEVSKGADIYFHAPGVGNTSLRGGRSEQSFRFFVSEFGSQGYGTLKIADYTVIGLTNTDGQGIQLANAPIVLENIVMTGATAPQYVYVPTHPDSNWPAQVTANEISSEHPYPFQSPWARPGRIIRSRGTRFVGDAQYQVRGTMQPERWTRRKNVTSAAAYAFDPVYADALDVRLSANAGPFALASGVIGQRFTLCFEQDGIGGRTWSWPANVGFSGAEPDKVTTSRNRQSAELRWTGRYWECLSIANTTPPAAAINPVVETFATGNKFWLGIPSGGGINAWEHVPGGGSLGISGGACHCNSLNWVGDKDLNNAGLVTAQGAAAVIETGMHTTPKGISATFTWQNGEGIICHYLDDQTFFAVWLTSGLMFVRGWSHGVISNYGTVVIAALVVGSTHTLLVKCTGTGLDISLDGALLFSPVFSATDQALYGDLTKHGIIATSHATVFSAFSVT